MTCDTLKHRNEDAPPNNVPNFFLEVRLLSWKFTSLIMDERKLPNANLASIPESKIVGANGTDPVWYAIYC
jgi:hypothetical protein